MKQQSIEYQRIEQLKKSLNIQTDTEFSRFLGLKNSQIFSEIKRGKSKISQNIATLICSKCPQVNYEWLLIGNGEMLRATNVVANNSNAVVQSNDTDNKLANLTAENDRLLSLLEKQQAEREKFLEIIANLTARKNV